jgi:hypothetical protein
MGNRLLFSVRTRKGVTGLIALHPEVGNYSVEKNPLFEYRERDKLDFFCPVCHTELSSSIHDRLARIIMLDENALEYEVLFSKVAGEKSTYKIIGKTMEVYGDDSAEYLDFLNLTLNL